LRGADHDGVHIDTGNGHQLGVQAAALHDFLHLHDNPAAAVLAGLRHGGDINGADLPVNGAVAELVGIAGADKHHVDGEALVQQQLLPFHIHHFDQVLCRGRVQLTAAVAGIGKGIQAHGGKGSHVVSRDVTVHVGDDALGQIVCLNFICQCQITQLGRPVPVTAHHALDHPLMAVVIAAGSVPMPLPCGKEQRQIPGVSGLQKTLLQRFRKRFGAGAADKAARGNGIAVAHQLCRLLGAQNFHSLHTANSLSRDLLMNADNLHLFSNVAGRFSRKAVMPSFWSAVA